MTRKQLAQNLALALGSILFMLLLIEGATRLLLTKPQPSRFQLSPLLGWEWTPGYEAVEHYKGADYHIAISQQGLRNETVAIPKPAGTYRIIALGDSIVAAPGVAQENTFVKQLEHQLQAQSASSAIEVVNAGTDDYGTEQELIWLRERGLAYEPDLLILHIYLNDSRSFGRPAPLVARFSNFFDQHSAAYTFYKNLLNRRLVAQETGQRDFRFRYRDALEAGEWVTDSAALSDLIQEADQDWGLAWYDQKLLRIEELVLQIAAIAGENDFPLLLVIFPVSVQVYAQVDTPLDLTGPQYELVTFAGREGLPVLDLLPVLRAVKDDYTADALFFDQVHLKPPGHALVATAIGEAMGHYQLGPPSVAKNEHASDE